MSVKDLVAHITWYEREMVNVMATRNLSGSELWVLSLDPRNQAIMEANHERMLGKVLEEARQVHRQLLAELNPSNDEDLVNPARVQNMPGEWIPWQVLASNTYEDYQQHVGDLLAWIETHPGRGE